MNSLMIKASPEELTNIYFESYRKFREKDDAVPCVYTAEDYIKAYHSNDDALRNTALLIYESHKDNLSSIIPCDGIQMFNSWLNSSYINDKTVYPLESILESHPYEPYTFYIDMSASHNVELLKEKELGLINKMIEVIPFRKDRDNLLKVKKSGYFASTIAKIEQ